MLGKINAAQLVLVFLSATLLFPTQAFTQSDESQTDTDQRLQSLYRQVRCPVCPAQPISESEAPLSKILRQELAKKVKTGMTNKDAIEWLVERYGEEILLRPRFNSAMLLWLAPIACAAIAILALRTIINQAK